MATPTYDLISEQVLSSAAASVTFSSIPGTYKDLVLEIVGNTTGSSNLMYRVNGDSATNYSETRLSGNGTAATSSRGSNTSDAMFGNGFIAATPAICVVNFMNYASTTTYKTSISRNSQSANQVSLHVNTWRSTAAITSIVLYCTYTWSAGCTFRLYGIAG